VTIDRLAAALSVEPGELTNEGGVTIMEEREGNRVRKVRQYDDFTLEISYDTSRLGDVYRLLLKRRPREPHEAHLRNKIKGAHRARTPPMVAALRSPLPGDQRSSSRSEPDEPLAGVCGLGEPDPGGEPLRVEDGHA